MEKELAKRRIGKIRGDEKAKSANYPEDDISKEYLILMMKAIQDTKDESG